MNGNACVIRPYSQRDWTSLMLLRTLQLQERGIDVALSDLPTAPQDSAIGSPEWDLDHLDELYLAANGGFWLAWSAGIAVGQIGAQDCGHFLELRRMYVRPDSRSNGIGSSLVQRLIDHARSCGSTAIELWTEQNGAGQRLYSRFGFSESSLSAHDSDKLTQATGWTPGRDQIRMRLEL